MLVGTYTVDVGTGDCLRSGVAPPERHSLVGRNALGTVGRDPGVVRNVLSRLDGVQGELEGGRDERRVVPLVQV